MSCRVVQPRLIFWKVITQQSFCSEDIYTSTLLNHLFLLQGFLFNISYNTKYSCNILLVFYKKSNVCSLSFPAAVRKYIYRYSLNTFRAAVRYFIFQNNIVQTHKPVFHIRAEIPKLPHVPNMSRLIWGEMCIKWWFE